MQVTQDYEVKLPIFEGPLDLLVFLVQKNELNPKEIPIAEITDQYLNYMEQIGTHNLSEAGEFLVMASRLMRLKARELLPADQKDEIEDMEYELDKAALIGQMLEHQKFKEAANFFRHMETRHFGSFPRGTREKIQSDKSEKNLELDFFEPGIYELLNAYSSAIKNTKKVHVHQIEIDDVTIENQIKKMQQMLRTQPKYLFDDIFKKDPRNILIVVSFMAMLELTKIGDIRIHQHVQYGPIWIYQKTKDEASSQDLRARDMTFSEIAPFQAGLVEFLQNDLLKKKEETEFDRLIRELETHGDLSELEDEEDLDTDEVKADSETSDITILETVHSNAEELNAESDEKNNG